MGITWIVITVVVGIALGSIASVVSANIRRKRSTNQSTNQSTIRVSGEWRKAFITAPLIFAVTGWAAFMVPRDWVFLGLAIIYGFAFGSIALLSLLRGGWKTPGALFFTAMFLVFTFWLFYVAEVAIERQQLPYDARRTLYWFMAAFAILAMEYYPWRRHDVEITANEPVSPAALMIAPVADQAIGEAQERHQATMRPDEGFVDE